MHQHHENTGSCHCGALSWVLASALALEQFVPRACDCSYCQRHGAAWISDPNGHLTLTAADARAVGCYWQGAALADMLFCRRCGNLTAVVYTHEQQRYGAVNTACMAQRERLGAAQVASPQRLSAADKMLRWRALWCPQVTLDGFVLPKRDGAATMLD